MQSYNCRPRSASSAAWTSCEICYTIKTRLTKQDAPLVAVADHGPLTSYFGGRSSEGASQGLSIPFNYQSRPHHTPKPLCSWSGSGFEVGIVRARFPPSSISPGPPLIIRTVDHIYIQRESPRTALRASADVAFAFTSQSTLHFFAACMVWTVAES